MSPRHSPSSMGCNWPRTSPALRRHCEAAGAQPRRARPPGGVSDPGSGRRDPHRDLHGAAPLGRDAAGAVRRGRFWASRTLAPVWCPRAAGVESAAVRNTAAVRPRLQEDNVVGLIISAVIVGLITRALGRLAFPGCQDIPIWLTILIGIVAALIGSLIASALGVGDPRDRLDQANHSGGPRCGRGAGRRPVRTWERGPVAQATADRAGIQPHRSTSQARIMPRTRARCVQGWPDRACNRADACCCGARLGAAVGRLELCRYCPIRRCRRLIRPAAKFG